MNGDGDLVRVGLGWLDGTAKTPEPREVIDAMRARFGEGTEVPSSGFFGSAMAFDGRRARVEWDGRKDAEGYTRATVTQTALDGLGFEGSVGLLASLDGLGYRPSRLDQWIDDYGRRITPQTVAAAVQGGQAVTHAGPGRLWRDLLTGRETFYMGRPTSDRQTRTYDKGASEVGPVDRARHELQARRDQAAHGARLLLDAAPADRPAALMANVISFADFRAHKGRSDGARAPRLPWWQAVVGDTRRAEAVPSRPRLTTDELAAWFDRSMGRTLALLHREMGREWVDAVLKRGHLRLMDFEAPMEKTA